MSEGGGILNLKRWHRVPYQVAEGLSITMELKRLKRHEARPLQKLLGKLFRKSALAKNEDLTPAEKAEVLEQVYDDIPEEQLKAWFAGCVRRVEGLVIDGDPVTSGEALLDEADDQLVLHLLFKLFELSKLTDPEGKGSSSRSTSSPAELEASSSSAAQSTGGEAGPEPLDATAMPAESSSVPVEA